MEKQPQPEQPGQTQPEQTQPEQPQTDVGSSSLNSEIDNKAVTVHENLKKTLSGVIYQKRNPWFCATVGGQDHYFKIIHPEETLNGIVVEQTSGIPDDKSLRPYFGDPQNPDVFEVNPYILHEKGNPNIIYFYYLIKYPSRCSPPLPTTEAPKSGLSKINPFNYFKRQVESEQSYSVSFWNTLTQLEPSVVDSFDYQINTSSFHDYVEGNNYEFGKKKQKGGSRRKTKGKKTRKSKKTKRSSRRRR
jgi:hypothetical protein